MKLKLLFTLFIGLFSQSVLAQLSPAVVCTQPGLTVPQVECEALVALYNDAGGASWTDGQTWGTADVGSWEGVAVSGNRVVTLNRSTSGSTLNGVLPDELWSLTGLRTLLLFGDLSGSLSPQIANLAQLEILVISGLGGQIPSEIGGLTNLTEIRMSNNGSNNVLTGSIPITFGNLANLRVLRFDHNQLTGNIPTELGNLSNLETLYLDHNNFSGMIPSALGNLSNLRFLYLSVNQLTGTLPDSFVGLTSLDLLNVAENQLDADANNNALIPASLSTWANNGVAILGQDQTVAGSNNPPTIGGVPAAVAVVAMNYVFTPTASDPDVGDSLSFSISNQPAWAGFNNTDGTLSGTPTATDVGIYTNIMIQVSDGVDTASLSPFSITVQAGGVPTAAQQVPILSFWAWALLIVLLLVSVKMIHKKGY